MFISFYSGHFQLLLLACSNILEDESYDPSLDTSKVVIDVAGSVKKLCSCPTPTADVFCQWLVSALTNIVTKAAKRVKKISTFKERVWSQFHALRSSSNFEHRWSQFLGDCNLQAERLFYQQVSLHIMTQLVVNATPAPAVCCAQEEVVALTYEEENAVRYMGGYIIRALKKDNKKSTEILLQLKDLVNDDADTEPAESEEWICSIDRGGLIRISDDMYNVLTSIEYVTRTFYNTSSAGREDCREKVVGSIIDASEVQFYWSLASSQMDEESKELILEQIVSKWVTIRGFSFTRSILEQYKKEAKKTTQKAKPLRSTLCTSSSTNE